jgi:hypothetical protein
MLRSASLADPVEPAVQPGQVIRNRLPDIAELVDVAIEADVRDREPLAFKNIGRAARAALK